MPFWKLLLVPLGVLVVAGAYAAGVLAESPAAPTQLAPIVLQDEAEQAVPGEREERRQGGPRRGKSAEPTPEATREASPEVEDDDDEDDDVRVVIPEPTEVDDREDDREDRGDDSRDDDD